MGSKALQNSTATITISGKVAEQKQKQATAVIALYIELYEKDVFVQELSQGL